MNKNLAKKIVATTMAVSVLAVSSSGAMAAFNFGHKWQVKTATNEYVQAIKDLVHKTGDDYEKNAEDYPDNAVENPTDAPADYVDTATKLGKNFLDTILGLTKDYTKNINDSFETEEAPAE